MTAAELADACGVDLKTIHNWIDKGRGPEGFRTPGRHLRFQAPVVAAWMQQRGMPIPGELKSFLPADEKLAADMAELTALVVKMTYCERGLVLERARGIVAARIGAVA